MEEFFGYFKEKSFATSDSSGYALAVALPEYIRWYNTERISTMLKGLSPVQYRAQTLAP